MEFIGGAITTNLLSALVGRQLMNQAISDASGSIYTNISSVFNYNLMINDTLNLLDIREKIKTIEHLINNIEVSNIIIDSCITSIHDVIILIREDLKLLNILVQNHKEKYFSKWRRLDCKKNLKDLKIHNTMLNSRFDNLIKATNILDSTSIKNSEKSKIKLE
jgi:hypothetical protein